MSGADSDALDVSSPSFSWMKFYLSELGDDNELVDLEDGLSTSWLNKVRELESVVKKLGKLPVGSEPMGKWLYNQRYAAKENGGRRALHPNRIAVLDEKFPGWRMSRDEKWAQNASRLVEIKEQLGRLPNRGEELGDWLATQRDLSKSRGWSWKPERQRHLDEHFPGWRSGRYSKL